VQELSVFSRSPHRGRDAVVGMVVGLNECENE
jgi:hypothetical protein